MMIKRMLSMTLAAGVLAALFACSDGARVLTEPGPMGAGGSGEPGPGEGPGEPATPETQPASEQQPGSETPGAHETPGMQEPAAGGTSPDPDSASETGVDEPVAPEFTFVTPRGPCAFEDRVGGFSIEKQKEFGVVQGTVYDGVVPTAIPRLAQESGACRLLERRTLGCLPACVGAETCGENGTCIPYPRQVSVGSVSIEGLVQATAMEPQAPGANYFFPDTANPPYAVGSEVILAAAGAGELVAFQLFGIGSEPLSVQPVWNLQAGQDLAVTWPAPTSAVAATVLIEVTIDQHGASPLTLSCEFPDTGDAVVPAALVDAMINAGVSGFPNGRLVRRTADHVDTSVGCVDLVVGSPLSARVAVAGFTPCDEPGECPPGQECNLLLQRCE